MTIGHWAVEVEVSSHDALKDGVLAVPRGLVSSRYRCPPRTGPSNLVSGPRFTTVVLAAGEVATDCEALCVAAQVAACTSGMMPTRTELTSWPTVSDRSSTSDRRAEEWPMWFVAGIGTGLLVAAGAVVGFVRSVARACAETEEYPRQPR